MHLSKYHVTQELIFAIYTKYPTEDGKEKGEKNPPLSPFLNWLYHHMHLLIILPSYWGNGPPKGLPYRYPTLQPIKEPLNFLLQFKTQDIGVVTMGTRCRTPHCVKPSLKHISLNFEVVPADFYEWLFFQDAETSLLSWSANCGMVRIWYGIWSAWKRPRALVRFAATAERTAQEGGQLGAAGCPLCPRSSSGEGHRARTAFPPVAITNITHAPTLSAKCFHEAAALWTYLKASWRA